MQAGMAVGNLASAIGITNEDAALIADLKAGSEDAFALLIAQYHQPLYSLIARNLNDPADAADISQQEVFIKVFRSIRGFHGDASLRTWLYLGLRCMRRRISGAGGPATNGRRSPSTCPSRRRKTIAVRLRA